MAGSAQLVDTLESPAAPDLQNEVAYLSGLDANGDITQNYYWYYFSYADNFTHKWGAPTAGTPGGTVTYSFDPTSQWLAGEQTIIQAGLALWSAEANIQFVQVPYSTDPANQSQILFHYWSYGAVATATGYAATGNDPQPGQPVLGTTTAAETTFNPPQLNIGRLDSFTQYGGYGVDTVLHEEGHLLGLGHAGPYNGTVDPLNQQLGPYDTRQWSLMSYINPDDSSAAYFNSYPVPGTSWGTGADGYLRAPTTPMILDIFAAQRLYGVPANTPLSGGQVFGFHCNIPDPVGQFFDFTVNTAPVVTLWDEGGGNTLDVSGFSQGATIDLRQGGFSSVDGMTNDIGIAFGTAIDTAIGGPGDTTFVPNNDSDRIVGGGGWNTVDFFASHTSLFDRPAGSARTVALPGATDTLSGISVLAFLGSNDVITSLTGGPLIIGGSNDLFLGGAPAQVQVTTADTVVASSGSATVQAIGGGGAAGNLVFANGSANLVYQGGATQDTVVASHATVLGNAAAVQVWGAGPGSLIDYQGGAAAAVVGGDAGSVTVQGNQGGGLLVGGAAGGNLLVANGGAATMFGEGTGDRLVAANGATDLALLGAGAETVDASAASGVVAIYGGSGPDMEIGGGGLTVFQAGHGNATLLGGSGLNLFLFVNGEGGGSQTIANWGQQGQDWVELYGFGPGADAQVTAAAVHQGGSTIMTLPDGTHITFLGAAQVNPAVFF